MTKLIADAGATKTIWIMPGTINEQIVTRGIQPVLQVDTEIEAVIYDELFRYPEVRKATHIVFYGSGCGAWNREERVRRLLKAAFPKAVVEVLTDIEGAGRAAFQNGEGIILISGTGSSAGYMRGGHLTDTMNQPLWPQGDLGSGAHIGALILNDYFEGNVPERIKTRIDTNRKLSEDDLFVQFQHPDRSKQIGAKALKDVVQVYDPTPETNNYLQNIAFGAFQEWFEALHTHFKNALTVLPVTVCGSTGSQFEEQIRSICDDRGITLDRIVKDPMEGLIRFHETEKDRS